MNLVFSYRLTSKVFSNCYYYLRCVCPGMLKLPKITGLIFLCNILRKNWVMKLIFFMQHESLLQIDSMLMVKNSQSFQNGKFAMSLQYFKKKLKLKLILCMQSFLKVYFNTLSIKVSYKIDIIIINGHNQVFSNYWK